MTLHKEYIWKMCTSFFIMSMWEMKLEITINEMINRRNTHLNTTYLKSVLGNK